jgi:putative PIN family toxin of toxin-antitoxin system
MRRHEIAIDTNVIVAGLRSRRGASFRLLSILGRRADVQIHVSVPLILECEEAAKAQAHELGLTHEDVDDVLDYLCSVAEFHEIFYLWRPILRDPGDDMVLEVAVSAGCDTVVTYNKQDFVGSEGFGVRIDTAKEFLKRIGELK